MDIRRVRYFLALSGTLDFSRTARALGITQPALTKAMNRLEDEIGGKLIRREGRHTHLTPLGEAMTQQFAEVDRAARDAEEAARRITRGIGSQIRLGIHPSIGPCRLVELLLEFHRGSPDTIIELHDLESGDLHDALLSGQLDCAFTIASDNDEPRLHHVALYDEPWVVVRPSGQPTAERATDAPHALIATADTDASAVWMDAVTEQLAGVQPFVVIASSERDDWTQAMVGAGLGLSVLPRDSVIDASVRTESLAPGTSSRTLVLAVPTGREDNPTIRAFLDLARGFSEREPGDG